jgi:DNA-binding response OmpR family regulator
MKRCGRSPNVLVAEDETLVGMALDDALTDAGYSIAGVFGTCSAAIEWIDQHPVDAAVIDFVLTDGACDELLRKLKSQGVPTLLYSGLNDVPAEFRDLPFVVKPSPLGEVVGTLDKLMLSEDTGDQFSARASPLTARTERQHRG